MTRQRCRTVQPRWWIFAAPGLILATGILAVGGHAADAAGTADPATLVLKEHRFAPDHIEVPAGERFQIVVHNQDDTASEFESSDLKVEKIVAPGSTITVRAGPLHPGSYKFFDDYHPDTASGTVTAVAADKN